MNINKLVKPISNNDLIYFLDNWVINWIWIRGENLENLVLSMIQTTYKFDESQSYSLLVDIRTLSYYHDIFYSYRLGFYYSNLWFCYKLYKLIDWDVWYRRIAVFLGVLFLLNKYWKENYGQN